MDGRDSGAGVVTASGDEVPAVKAENLEAQGAGDGPTRLFSLPRTPRTSLNFRSSLGSIDEKKEEQPLIPPPPPTALPSRAVSAALPARPQLVSEQSQELFGNSDEPGYGATRLRLDDIRSVRNDGGGRMSPVQRERAKRNWGRMRERILRGSVMIRSFTRPAKDAEIGIGDLESRGELTDGRGANSAVEREGSGGDEGKGALDASDASLGPYLGLPSRKLSLGSWVKSGWNCIVLLASCSPRNLDRGNLRSREGIDSLPYDLSLCECTLLLSAYLLVAVVAFSVVFEKWPIVDSLYFAVVTFTTVGYGDLAPESEVARLFTALFALCGIAFLGVVLGVLGSRIVEEEISYVKAAERETTRRVSTMFRNPEGHVHGGGGDGDGADEECGPRAPRHKTRDELKEQGEELLPWNQVAELMGKYWPALVIFFLGAFVIAWMEGWGVCSAIYFSVVTMSTIGYGDVTPSVPGMKWISVIYIPLAVGVMGHIMGVVANFVIERRREVHQKKLWCRDFTLNDLEAMGGDKNGVVSELDYIEFMLIALKKVDRELFTELRCQFADLDVSHSGELTKKDLKVLAKRRLKRVRRKLDLSDYKRQLLLQRQLLSQHQTDA